MKNACDICNGSGQVTYFKGESRFHLSWEDCPACNGSGFQGEEEDSGKKEKPKKVVKGKSGKKNKKG